jgi:hypothetical protein
MRVKLLERIAEAVSGRRSGRGIDLYAHRCRP